MKIFHKDLKEYEKRPDYKEPIDYELAPGYADLGEEQLAKFTNMREHKEYKIFTDMVKILVTSRLYDLLRGDYPRVEHAIVLSGLTRDEGHRAVMHCIKLSSFERGEREKDPKGNIREHIRKLELTEGGRSIADAYLSKVFPY